MWLSNLSSRLALFGAWVAIAAVGTGGIPSAMAHSFVAIGVGAPLYFGPPAYYAPPPPPVVYVPSPAQVYPVAPTSAPVGEQEECREYQSTSTIDGQPQQTFGTVCRQADGTWRIVN